MTTYTSAMVNGVLSANFSEEALEWLEENEGLGLPRGWGCTEIGEPVPSYHYSDCEKHRFQSGYNSMITLGKDRHASRFSGAGGLGETQCGMIDLVAGRMGSTINKQLEQNQKPMDRGVSVGMNWFADAARVYITQKTKNIDRYLGFPNTKGDSEDLSAVVIKSDCTRIVGRESVRIYTGSSKTGEGWGRDGELRSNATPIQSPRIELVGGGNDTDLQPAILGDNLVLFLKENNKTIADNMRAIVLQLMKQITTAHTQLALMSLGSSSVYAAKVAIENTENAMGLITDLLNVNIDQINFLDEGTVPGNKSILSKKVYIT